METIIEIRIKIKPEYANQAIELGEQIKDHLYNEFDEVEHYCPIDDITYEIKNDK